MKKRRNHREQIPRLYIVNDPTVLRIVPSLAAEIGLNESILLMQIDFLKSISTAENHKGRPWTYQSIRDLQEHYFPFWSKDTINRAISSLQEQRLIRCGNFNKAAYDKTRWISINYGKCRKLKSVQVGGMLSQIATRSTQIATRSTQIATTIPETSTENTTDKSGGGWSLADKGLKPTKTTKEPKVKKARDFSAIEPVLAILHSEDQNAHKAISLNTQKMIEHEIEEHGVDYVCNAVRGRMYAVKGTGKPLMLTAFFDPDKAEWRADMAKLGERIKNASEGLKMAFEENSQDFLTDADYDYIYKLMSTGT